MSESVNVNPVARSTRPTASRGVELPPVKGNVWPVGCRTVVEVTTGTAVVVVRGAVTVVPATLVVDVAASVVVVTCVVVVVGATTAVVAVGNVVVVVDVGTVVVAIGSVVVEPACSVVVVDAGCVVVVVDGGAVVVVVVLVVVDAVVDVEVELLVVGGVGGPQNCTFEIAGRFFPLPTFGSPTFEKVPEYCGDASLTNSVDVPPFTRIADTGLVDCHVPPVEEALVIVTTCELPAGFSNTYPFE
jgi:hypothetical protein